LLDIVLAGWAWRACVAHGMRCLLAGGGVTLLFLALLFLLGYSVATCCMVCATSDGCIKVSLHVWKTVIPLAEVHIVQQML
jgi:hypothetical protein